MKNSAEEINLLDFPAVKIVGEGGRWEGSAALDLDSILAEDLIRPDNHHSQDGEYSSPALYGANAKRLQEAREALLQAIVAWSPKVTLELRLASLPDIRHKAQGRFWITLAIRAYGDSESDARERTIRAYLDLRPLLVAHWPEAEFYPVAEASVLESRLSPFDVGWAASIGRRRESVLLSAPMKKIVTLGFGGRSGRSSAAEPGGMVEHTYPWIPSLDRWERLLDLLSSLMDPVVVLIRIRPGAESGKAIRVMSSEVETCEAHLARLPERQYPKEKLVVSLRDACLDRIAGMGDCGFRLGVFLLSPYSLDSSATRVLGAAISDSKVGSEGRNPYTGMFQVQEISSCDVLRSDFFADEELFDAREAACAFRLPSPPAGEVAGLPVKYSRTSLALMPSINPPDAGTIRLFINEHRGNRRPISIGVEDRMRHFFVVGQTGTGKSTFMENMIVQDIREGRGVAFIDPHGDSVDKVLAAVPPDRAEDVVLFDFLDRERPVGFNPLQWSTIEERDLLIDELYLTLDRIYDMKSTGGPIFENNYRSMMKLLMGDGSKARKGFTGTLLEFISCYTNGNFREWLTKTIDDPQLAEFILELEGTRGEASLSNLSPYITSKFGRFVNDSALRRIIGQEKTGFDVDNIMNTGKIFLVKLGKGRFGSTVSALLTNMLVQKFKLAAMKRGDCPAGERRPFFLYVDEAQNLPPDNLSELLSQARKFGMSLVLATQYCRQIGRRGDSGAGNDLLAAVHGNVGTIVVFRLGLEDAREMARLLYPRFSERDIVSLPNFRGYTRILSGAVSTLPFSFRAVPADFPRDEERAEKIRLLSRLKYGMDGELVDKQISRRRKGFIKRHEEDEK